MGIDSITGNNLNSALLNGMFGQPNTVGGTMDNLAVASQVAQGQVQAARQFGTQSSASTTKATNIPPWYTNPGSGTPTIDTVFLDALKPLVDLQDPTLSRPDLSSTYKSMFALYKGLTRMQNIATFASTNAAADTLRPELNNAFQSLTTQLNSYIDTLKLDKVTLLAGVKHDSETSTALQAATPLVYDGSVVANSGADAVAGLTGTEKFTLTATKSDGTSHSVALDLSQIAGVPSLDNIATYINDTLKADGNIGTTVSVVPGATSGYRLEILAGYDETVSLTADPTNQQAAVYVTGTSGTGTSATGFLTKYDGLSGTQPAEAFQQAIHSDIATSFTVAPGSTELPASATGGGITTGATARDSQGNIYVVGTTTGNIEGQINQGTSDVFLRKYDPSGKEVFTRMLGASSANGVALAVDANDNVVVAGSSSAPLTNTATGGGSDTFVTKFDSAGHEIFTHQAAPAANDGALGLTVDASGNIFVSGTTQGAVSSSTSQTGSNDAFVTKLDSTGAVVYNQQFGSAAGANDKATAVTVDNAGNFYVLVNDNGTAKLRKYADSAATTPLYETNLGSVGQGDATGLARDGAGNVYVTGTTDGATLNGTVKNAYSSGTDGFVAQVNESTGAINYVSYLGGGNTQSNAIAVQGNDIYLTGSTDGQIGNATKVGTQDGFLAKLDATTGQVVSAQQFGGTFDTRGTGITIDPTGTSVLSRLGLPNGTVPPAGALGDTVVQASTARDGQYFTIAVGSGAPKTITLSNSDSFGFLAFRINQVLGDSGIASVTSTGNLQIKAINNAKVTIGKGADGQDLLSSLGLKPQTLYGGAPGALAVTTSSYTPSSSATAASNKASGDPSIFGLGFISGLDLLSQKNAGQALDIVNFALLQIRKAYDFTVYGAPQDPATASAKQGSVPSYLTKQLASYQQALNQVSALNASAQATPTISLI